jgi:uncharacterized protein (DUF1800 family)
METEQSAVDAFRFGYGLPGIANGFGSVDRIMQQLAAAEPVPARLRGSESSRRLIEKAEMNEKVRNAGDTDQAAQKQARKLANQDYYQGDCNNRLLVAVESKWPFFERLVSFWSNHFTVSIKKPAVRALAGPYEVEALRPHIMGKFRDMLKAVELHPAMVLYLDLVRSMGPNSEVGRDRGKGLNENLAREVLELHTLGVNGGYTQNDVTEFAKLMTGWTVKERKGKTVFDVRRAEPGTKSMLGVKIGAQEPSSEDYPEALNLLAKHPSTAKFIARKLVEHFISDAPDDGAVHSVATAFVSSDGDLPVVYRALLTASESVAFGKKARNDFEYVIASFRAAGVKQEDISVLAKDGRKRPNPLSVGALAKLAQPMWGASSPAGWPERAEDWLSPVGLAQRLRWVPSVVALIKDQTAEGFLDRVLGPIATDQTRSVIRAASNREEGLALVLASPEFNRR